MTVVIYNEECLSFLPQIENEAIDLILTDLPYATTYAPWDALIPLDALWKEWLRCLKPRGAIVLTASQPFTSQLVMSQPRLFRCEWIWDKVNGANFANANRQPLKTHESILVFSKVQPTYNPQKTLGKPNHKQGSASRGRNCVTQLISERVADNLTGLKFPKSIQTFPKHSSQSKLHPTQKPVELFEYLIRTYSNEGDIVLDCCAGSGTTGVAANSTRRHAILIEKDAKYFDIMKNRLFNIVNSTVTC